jgi:hypothetical protein
VKRPRRTRPEPPNEEKLRDFLERIEDFERNIKKEIDDIVAIVPKDERERKREEMEMKGGIRQVYVEKVIAPQIKNGHGERIRSMAWDLCFDLDHIVGGPRWKWKRRFAFRVGFNGVQVSVLTFVPKRGVERELALARRYMAHAQPPRP